MNPVCNGGFLKKLDDIRKYPKELEPNWPPIENPPAGELAQTAESLFGCGPCWAFSRSGGRPWRLCFWESQNHLMKLEHDPWWERWRSKLSWDQESSFGFRPEFYSASFFNDLVTSPLLGSWLVRARFSRRSGLKLQHCSRADSADARSILPWTKFLTDHQLSVGVRSSKSSRLKAAEFLPSVMNESNFSWGSRSRQWNLKCM